MPLYTYLCKSCMTEWEVLKKMTDHTKTHDCSFCGEKNCDQQIGKVGISGFTEGEGWEEEVPYEASIQRKAAGTKTIGAT